MWCVSATYHSIVLYVIAAGLYYVNVISNADMKTIDFWSFGAMLYHLIVVIVSLKLWLQARYHTMYLVASVLLSILASMAVNVIYSSFYLPYDGDVLGTYNRLMSSITFWLANVVIVVASLVPDFGVRFLSDIKIRRFIASGTQTVFSTRL